MTRGEELWRLEVAAADDHAFIDRPNVVLAERVEGRLVVRGRTPVVLCPDGRAVKLAEKRPGIPMPCKRVFATIVEQVGERPRAHDVSPC